MKKFVKINGALYPCKSFGTERDGAWDGRSSVTLTLMMDYAAAASLFTDGAVWSIVQQNTVPVYETDENGEDVQVGETVEEHEHDKSAFSLAGDITDHRDGTLSVKMGRLTELEEAYGLLLGGV